MTDRKEALIRATASLQDIISQGKAITGSAMRGAPEADQEAIRAAAHAHLDAYLDHMAAAGVHTRAIIED